MATELTIVVPTYNEKDNILPLIELLHKALQGIAWEVLFVDDDSSDGTAGHVRDLAQMDQHVRCIQRIGRKNLASACIEGFLASASPYLCVIDADMQHDERLLPHMLHLLKTKDINLVIGSRYIEGGSTGKLPATRIWISRMATLLSHLVLKYDIRDPMSGFFMLQRSFFEQVMRKLSGKGFKILLDILISCGDSAKIIEQPYIMRERSHGESKLSVYVIWNFLTLVAYKFLGRIIPFQFLSFAAVGCTGIFVHLSVLWLSHRILMYEFMISQITATLVAMTSNFILNNTFTFGNEKLAGVKIVKGLMGFYLACSIGAVINVAVADLLFNRYFPWWLAGMCGAVAGAVWNYALTATFIWRNNSHRHRVVIKYD